VAEESSQEGILQASKERRGNKRNRKGRLQASKKRWKYSGGGEQPTGETTGKQREMEI